LVGVVEGLFGYGRRNTMVPIPEFDSFAALNTYLEACCLGDLTRRVRGKAQTKAELLEIDRAALLPLPMNTFEARRVVGAKANSLSLVRFDRNDYSVPTAWAHHDVTVVGGIDEVAIVVGPTVVARHRRCWAKERTTYDPRHYLALLERKPGAFDVAKPLERWELPACFALLRRRLESDLGSAGTREFCAARLRDFVTRVPSHPDSVNQIRKSQWCVRVVSSALGRARETAVTRKLVRRRRQRGTRSAVPRDPWRRLGGDDRVQAEPPGTGHGRCGGCPGGGEPAHDGYRAGAHRRRERGPLVCTAQGTVLVMPPKPK
jgi:hypothetical protein